MNHLGDFADDATVRVHWSTNATDGSSITRSTDGALRVYVNGNAAQISAGITDTEDFDGVTGCHLATIDLSADAGYVAGAECALVLVGAVIDTKTVNAVIAQWSIERAGGILALAKGANGFANIFSRLGAPAGASMSADVAAVKAQTAAIEADTQDLQTRVPAALVGGLMPSNLTAAGLQADAVAEIQSGLATGAGQVTINDNVLAVGAALAIVDGIVDAIKAKTDGLPADPADQSILATAIQAVQTVVDAILVDTAEIGAAGAGLTALASAANLALVKAKTDLLAFTSGRVHADAKAVAGVVVQTNGSGTQSMGGPA